MVWNIGLLWRACLRKEMHHGKRLVEQKPEAQVFSAGMGISTGFIFIVVFYLWLVFRSKLFVPLYCYHMFNYRGQYQNFYFDAKGRL